MPYDDIDSYYTYDSLGYSPSDILDFNNEVEGFFVNSDGESETEYVGLSSDDNSSDNSRDSNLSDVDYTTYLEDIITNQEFIITNQETLISLNTEIQNNGYRLYYFVGGLYVAFAIIIMVKFFKTFLF